MVRGLGDWYYENKAPEKYTIINSEPLIWWSRTPDARSRTSK